MPAFCGLQNDVFISYAQADNTLGWVTEFHNQLANRLRELDRKAPFVVWRDTRLGGMYILSSEIADRLKSSGVLISILSPNGLDSQWCQRERQSFEIAASQNGGFRIGNKVRALRVTKAPCKNNKDRDLFGTLGHDFYRHNRQTSRFDELHPSSSDFQTLVLEIAQEIFDLLKELRDKRSRIPSPDLSIYLAAAAPGSICAEWRERVATELTGACNCRVLPENPDPDQLSKAAINALLRECDLTLHWATASATELTDKLQWECALALPLKRVVCEVSLAGSPLPAPEWLKERPADPNTPVAERIRASAPDQLIQYFEDFVKWRRQTPERSPDQLPLVYVICALDEFDDALVLKQCLESDNRFAAVLPIREADDGKTRLSDHRSWLRTCQAALVYWGGATKENWFREQQREIIAMQVKRKGRPLRAICLALSANADPTANSLPNFPLQRIARLECATVRPHFRDLEPRAANEASAP
jgi:hypothetical protein